MPPITRYAERADLVKIGINADALAKVGGTAQDEALDTASRWADGYINNRYTLPLLAITGDLTRTVCMIAVWDILTTRGRNPERQGDDPIRLRYLDAIKWLEGVRDGLINPGLTDSAPVPSGTNRARAVSSSSRGFSNRGTSNGRGGFVGD